MIIISWDVGIIHLAYCILSFEKNDDDDQYHIDILDWDNINLVEDDRIELICQGKKKAKKNVDADVCGKKASYYLTQSGEHKKSYIGFCKTHLNQTSEYWTQEDTHKLFSEIHDYKKKQNPCSFVKKSGEHCGKTSRYFYDSGENKNSKKSLECLCMAHYKSVLNRRIKEDGPQQIKNIIVKKYPTAQLQLNLINKLDSLMKHFSGLGIQHVIIENQPSYNNPKMKSISNTLFDYFMIRGYVDKIHNIDIQLVKFMSPSNKLRVDEKNTIKVFKRNKKINKKYKITKGLGIQYTKQLLSNDQTHLDYLDLYEKKDDLCDAYLQGRYYLEFDEKNNKNKKPKSGSKTMKKMNIKKKKNRRQTKNKTKKNKKKNKTHNSSSREIITL
jgi:hypothetical protein